MQGKIEKDKKAAEIFEVIYRVFLIVYILFSAVLLGVNFGVSFLSGLRDKLMNDYGNITVPTMIISTVLIFIPFCISVFFNIRQLNDKVDNITGVQIPSLKEDIEKTRNTLNDSQNNFAETDNAKINWHEEKFQLEQKLIDIQGAVNSENYINLQANMYINRIVMQTELASSYDLKNSMAEYEKSLDELKKYIHIDYTK